MCDLVELQEKLRAFAQERDWEQFHSPKNLSMAIACEAGELLELFQWLSETESKTIMHNECKADSVRQELADILIYVVRLADVMGIDLKAAATAKIALNEARYPVAASHGSARKCNELGNV
jgi:NTP pyrophosphatase (non-canonical NTP hydrolase)